MVWECSQAIQIPILGMGGIAEPADAIEFLLAGATAVQIGTANFADPFVWTRMIDGVEDYLRRHEMARVVDLVGKLDTSPSTEVHA